MARRRQVFEAERLQAEFDTYDKHVDIVSIFEWLFTETEELPGDVVHFERYPKIDDAGTARTPDFTVLFTDGTAIVGEISSIALHENSIEKACAQIGPYASLRHVPGPDGNVVEVAHLDVLLLVPMEAGPRAVTEIITNRLHDPDHPYSPDRPPCIAQFSRDDSKYVIQRLSHEPNGHLSPGNRTHHIEPLLDQSLIIRPDRFKRIKAARRFMNDSVAPLYLATHLWLSTWPTEFGSSREPISIDPATTAATLRRQYGAVKASDVRHALELFHAAGMATKDKDRRTWTVSRKTLRSRDSRDIAKIIATRASKTAPVEKSVRTREADVFGQDELPL